MKVKFLILPLLLLVFSCKKDKLEGDYAILTGTWNWTETQKVSNYFQPDSLWTYSPVDSAHTNNHYSLEFLEKGKVKFYINEGVNWNNRIVFHSKETINSGPYEFRFVIYMNNKSANSMELLVGADSMLLYDFPKDIDEYGYEYFNYFLREQ